MAILKHIANKSADYGKVLDYMLFQHDDFTKKELLDDKGRKMLREEYYIDGMNCEAMLFDEECEMVNEQYHKNKRYDEIKSHHYILSFDPNDKEDHALTGEKAQALGLEFARNNFPGHQALVCTHTDGHNGSGNVHVHIVINSVRKLDVEKQDFMERECDSRAGFKHHLTNNYLRHLQQSVMDICQRENLYQVNLLSPAADKISEKEYWVNRQGQDKLNELNKQIEADGLTPSKTVFQTQKQSLREAIAEIASTATSLTDFQSGLLENYNISLIHKRGRYSYHLPDCEKNISERALGAHYGKDYLLQQFDKNTKGLEKENTQPEEPQKPISSSFPNEPDVSTIFNPSYDYGKDPIAILFVQTNLQLVVDLQNCVKAQQSEAYAQKVKISNLQQMAKTIAYVQEHEYGSQENLLESFEEVSAKLTDARKTLKETETSLRDINQQIHYTGQYLANKKVYIQMVKSKNKGKFRNEHSSEIALYEAAQKFLKAKNPDRQFPSIKDLKAEKEKLTIKRSAQKDTYNYFRDYQKELRTVCSNVDSILGISRIRQQEQEKSQDIS
ncbi:MAG: relaxase/mobilization nuclease domain-containing protein [Anaerostipes sp.]|uniref:Relaxase/Mobilisation nuclease domain-containing protein n=1 Tax=Hespellia stercorisuis DSM 15480 TaxID=1121950 RepID=A0A1M6TJJ9_9FIRM|nr:relaxase/mobilization nuclease domain-containing protein [Hespellia stercorisuis]MDD3184568.1 relaxase/mobilization nuclease domain-containing protein [Anaerostipes sp.]SHK57089.1 Relaxase/Mobilisation nuclease domain-containing protein [Hespellia stercorisuis DSM 15480]HIT89229.1 relaxase/mobilization nuclease domain-containing protein [Candidatus Merdenecus merdavium]